MLAAALLGVASPAAAGAAGGPVGFGDFATSVNGVTGEKPQSKLWYNDGIWWADMFDAASSSWRIFRLDQTTQTWINTGTRVDERSLTWADTLWDGTHLYVASAGVGSTPSDKAQLYRYSYSAVTKSYTLDAGYPSLAQIAGYGMEAVVLAKDSAGALWATWTHGNQVYVNTTTPGDDTSWGTPFVVPGAGTTVAPDDISSVVAYNGHVGVMWSNQVPDPVTHNTAFYFAEHTDGAPAATWAAPVKVAEGPSMADDHISLKAAPDGTLFAMVKTSKSDPPNTDTTAPLLLLLKRTTAGVWSSTTYSTVGDDQTRPNLMLDPAQDRLYVFATTPLSGFINNGSATTALFYKSTTMSAPTFVPGKGTPFIQTDGDTHINNPTTSKQPVTAGSGLVVLASDNGSGVYMHNVITADGKPETQITSGPAQGSTSPTAATFGFSSSVFGSTFQCSLDGAAFSACLSPKPYTGLAVGAHTFAVRAVSGVNIDATPATRSWAVQLLPPQNVTSPSAGASAQRGSAQQSHAGTWNAATSVSEQWQRCTTAGNPSSCVDIAGATAVGYTPVQADVGAFLRLVETATNASGSTAAASAMTAAVADVSAPTTPVQQQQQPQQQPQSAAITGQGVPKACAASRSATVSWILPKHQRIVSVVIRVTGAKAKTLHGARHSIVLKLGNRLPPLKIEIKALTAKGKAYGVKRTITGCKRASMRGLHLRATAGT